MKIFMAIMFYISIMTAGNLPKQNFADTVKMLELQLKQKQPAKQFSFQNKQALEKFIAQIAKYYSLDKQLLMGIVRQESAYCKFKLNKVTGDSGCMQIHSSNIKAYGWNRSTLMKHDAANIVAGAIILTDFKKNFASKEPKTWACRYNIGYRNMPGQCISYLNKIYALK